MGTTATETYEGVSGAVQLVASQIGKHLGGAYGQAYATFLTGQNSWVASVSDLAEKVSNGTATADEFADVASKTASVLAGFGVMTGTASPVALTAAGVTGFALWAWKNRDPIMDYGDTILEGIGKINQLTAHPLGNFDGISEDTAGLRVRSAAAALAGTVVPRIDPLALDLDGDGIETTAPTDGKVVLFDHNADGIKTGTGWVNADDAWLVLDRNGNDLIDSGRELFGVDTIKRNGQFASDGFDALRDLDANNDGQINAADSVFASLRVWRDLNQDGISQGSELTSLEANSIESIGVTSRSVRTELGNGNVQTAKGTFTRANGAPVQTGQATGVVANLDLIADTFYRQFVDTVTLTEQALALPDIRGSGRVRDLREAISQSSDLGDWVQRYANEATRQGQLDQLDGFIERWAGTSEFKTLKAQAQALVSSGVRLSYSIAGLPSGTAAHETFLHKLGIVERFMGFTYGGAERASAVY